MGFFKKMFASLSTSSDPEPEVDTNSIGATSTADLPEEAQAVVAQLKDAFPGADVQVQTVDMSDNPDMAKQVMGMAEAATGRDLDGDGVVQGAVAGSAAATGAAPDDRIAQLERLAKLHEQGVLSESELATEKARILGSGG